MSPDLPDVADVGQQQGEVSQAQSLLLRGQAQFGDGPNQGVDHRVKQPQQLVPALQLLGRLRGACAKICSERQTLLINIDANQKKYTANVSNFVNEQMLH